MTTLIDLTNNMAEDKKLLLLVYRTNPDGWRIPEAPMALQVDAETLQRNSPRWYTTIHYGPPLTGTKPLGKREGFEVEVENTEAYFNMMAMSHARWDLVKIMISLQDLFDITIMAEKQSLWDAIKPHAHLWLEGCVFGGFSANTNTKSVFLKEPFKWLVISWLWGLRSIFDFVLVPAIETADYGTFNWVPQDHLDSSAGDSVFLASNEIGRLHTLSEYIKDCRHRRLVRYFDLVSDFGRHLMSPDEPCEDKRHVEDHDQKKCKKRLLRSLQSTCTALGSIHVHGENAANRCVMSLKEMLDELEVVANSLEYFDNISEKFCNQLKKRVVHEVWGRHIFLQPNEEMRRMLIVSPALVRFDPATWIWIESRVRQMIEED